MRPESIQFVTCLSLLHPPAGANTYYAFRGPT
ncbi:hypothetical protein ACVJGD_002177 [Bradyrhizobium sp. USDA 10063]